MEAGLELLVVLPLPPESWDCGSVPSHGSVTAFLGQPFFPLLSHSCADTPVFLAKPSVGFFTDYEIGPVYEVEILLYVMGFLNHTQK